MGAHALPRKPMKVAAPLAIVIGAGSLVVLTSGAAYAYMAGGFGTGAGTAATGTRETITASAATLSGTLYPGATADFQVTIKNPYSNRALTITGVTAGTGSVQVTGGSSCTALNSDVSVNTSASNFAPTTVAADATTAVTITGAVNMGANSATGCQGAQFTVPVAVTVKVG